MIRKAEEEHSTCLHQILINKLEQDKKKVAIILSEHMLNSVIRVYHNNYHGLLDDEKEFLEGLENLREEVFRKDT